MNKLQAQLTELIKTTISEENTSSSSSISLNRIQYLSILDHLETIIKKQKQEYLWELIQQVPTEVMVGNICPYLPLGFLLNGSMFLVCKRWYEGIYENEFFWRLLFTRLWKGFHKATEYSRSRLEHKNQRHESIHDLNEVPCGISDISGNKFAKKTDWKYLRKYCVMRRRRFLEADQPFVSFQTTIFNGLHMMKNYSKFFDCFYLKSMSSDLSLLPHFRRNSYFDPDGHCCHLEMRLDCFSTRVPACVAVYVVCNVSLFENHRARVEVDIDAEKIMTLSDNDDDDNDNSTMNNESDTHHSHRLPLYSCHIESNEVDRASKETVNYLNEENMSKVRAWYGCSTNSALKNHEWLYVLFGCSSLDILKEVLRSRFVPLKAMKIRTLDKMASVLSSNGLFW